MKVTYAIVVIAVAIAVTEGAPGFWDSVKDAFGFAKEAAKGTGDMGRAYLDMRNANWKNSDKYFHARGNYDAAQRGPGGKWASEVISNARERFDQLKGDSPESSAKDQEANEWGRNGGDPNKYRPEGLPSKW